MTDRPTDRLTRVGARDAYASKNPGKIVTYTISIVAASSCAVRIPNAQLLLQERRGDILKHFIREILKTVFHRNSC